MNKTKTLLIRIITVVFFVALAVLMYFLGRGHTVYIDNKKLEYNGTTYDTPYKVEVYSNNIKHSVLGVSQKTLDIFTEYSAETALEMAKGVRRISGADIGISTTGIAGPNGGTDEKPVGLVYVAVDSDNYSDVKKLLLSRGFSEERELIRYLASSHALYMGLTATKRL